MTIVSIIMPIALARGLFVIADEPTPLSQLDLSAAQARIEKLTLEYEQWEEDEDNNTTIDSSWLFTNMDPNIIVLHHSVVFDWNTEYIATAISNAHKKRWMNWYTKYQYNDVYTPDEWNRIANPSGTEYGYTMYHYVIWYDGTIINTRPLNATWWPTLNNNSSSIHIVMVWNFETHNPSSKQYKALNWLLQTLSKSNPQINKVSWHWWLQWEHTSCPWKNLKRDQIDDELFVKYDIDKVLNTIKQPAKKNYISRPKGLQQNVKSDPSYLWVFNITRYYSCTKDQTKYLSREVNTKQNNYTACNKRQFNWDIDNTQPKYWARFTNDDAWVAVACPPEIKAWTKLRIEWYDKIVICRDVWSAIKNKRLDMYAWLWDRAIENFHKFPAGNKKVRIVE